MKFEPISIWHHPSKVDYEFRVTHRLCDTEEEAFKTANQDWTFGLFVSENDLPKRKLHFGFLDKNGIVYHVPSANVKGYFLNPCVHDRIGSPIDISTEAGKVAASKAILEKDPAYMVSDDDYTEDRMITSSAGRERIYGAIEATPQRPLLFESIAYSIKLIE